MFIPSFIEMWEGI